MFKNQYKNLRVLVTGHTGFKGSWLVEWLNLLEADVYGISLEPTTSPSHFNLLNSKVKSEIIDIRNKKGFEDAIKNCNPHIIFHLAAQPLVRASYDAPVDTWMTNVIGTANLLESSRGLKELYGIVVVTTDKCYQNNEWVWGYRETDNLGGHDPYSGSKASAELLVGSFRDSFFNYKGAPIIATARAGNVIGGGDWSIDRLITDIIHSVAEKEPIKVRYPNSTRPWQNVLDCLSGYLLLGQKIIEQNNQASGAWNFGPNPECNKSVIELLEQFKMHFKDMTWVLGDEKYPHEAMFLYLDSSKSRKLLDWKPTWNFEISVKKTAVWYSQYLNFNQIVTIRQLNEYLDDSIASKASWII